MFKPPQHLNLQVQQWVNAPQGFSTQHLKGKPLAIFTFQMLCPGCVIQSIPQMKQAYEVFSGHGVQVVGLHTVFEHHNAMQPHALEAFIHEFRIPCPVGIDQPDDHGPIPKTMRAHGLRGTPSLLLVDHKGRVQASHFGHVPDMQLGRMLTLLADLQTNKPENAHMAAQSAGCSEQGCVI